MFVLDLAGVTASTTVTAATFSFGTGPDTFVDGTPGTLSPESLDLGDDASRLRWSRLCGVARCAGAGGVSIVEA